MQRVQGGREEEKRRKGRSLGRKEKKDDHLIGFY
jgi:hypothetical protein